MQSIVAETPVSPSPVGGPSVSLLAERDDPDVVLREQTAAALVSQRLPIVVLEDSAEGTQAVGSHDFSQIVRCSCWFARSTRFCDSIDLAMKAGDIRGRHAPSYLAGHPADTRRRR